MNTKKQYLMPQIEQILLDNEISLALQSNPPAGPEEGIGQNNFSIVQHVNKIV